jgi:hypothetical protein
MPAGGRFFMVMQLLGPNLSAARRAALGGQAELQAAKVGGWADGVGSRRCSWVRLPCGTPARSPAPLLLQLLTLSPALPLPLPAPLPVPVQIIGAGMLKALEQVHRAGFIHRDVKPANFVMAPADAPSPTAGAQGPGRLVAQSEGVGVGVRRRLPPCSCLPIICCLVCCRAAEPVIRSP